MMMAGSGALASAQHGPPAAAEEKAEKKAPETKHEPAKAPAAKHEPAASAPVAPPARKNGSAGEAVAQILRKLDEGLAAKPVTMRKPAAARHPQPRLQLAWRLSLISPDEIR